MGARAWGMGSPQFKRLTSRCLLSPVFPQLAAWSPAAAGLSPRTASRCAPRPCLWSSAFPSQAPPLPHLSTWPPFPSLGASLRSPSSLKRSLMRSKRTPSFRLPVCTSGCFADHFYRNLLDSICVVSITMARALAGFPLVSVPVYSRVRLRQAPSGSACPSSLAQACHRSGSRN